MSWDAKSLINAFPVHSQEVLHGLAPAVADCIIVDVPAPGGLSSVSRFRASCRMITVAHVAEIPWRRRVSGGRDGAVGIVEDQLLFRSIWMIGSSEKWMHEKLDRRVRVWKVLHNL
jgi:hypothetical protein